MKKLALLLSLLILATALFADYVEIGNGDTYDPVPGPFYNYWKSSHAQTLYYSEELGGENTFTSLSFNLERMSANYPELPNFTVKILAVDLEQFTDGAYYDMTGATEVFSADPYQPAFDIGWFDIDIDDFEYDGTSDLVIDIEFGQLANYDGTYYRNYKTASPGLIRMLEGHEDFSYPAGYSGSHEAYSNIRFNFFVVGAPGSPTNPIPENFAHTVALTPELSWDFGENTENYDLILDSVYPPTTMVVDNATAVGTGGTYDITENLDYQTTYYWRLISRNSNRVESYGPIWSFNTIFAPVEEDFETNDFSAHDWQFEGSDWVIDDAEAYSAYHSASSGVVAGSTTSIFVEKEVTDNGEISFAFKSTLYWNSDYKFYINDEEYAIENNNWGYVTYPVPSGSYTFKWELTSDASATGDQVWLDYISFPPTTVYDNDLAMRTISGPNFSTAGNSESYHVMIKNIGNLDQPDYSIRLMQEGDIELTSVSATETLIAGEIAEYDLIWDIPEAEDEGDTFIWAEVVFAGDDNPGNNIGDNLPVYIYPFGSSVIIAEGFEVGELPYGWTLEYAEGDTDWEYTNGGHSGNPAAAHTGNYNAQLYHGSSTQHVTRLVSPELNLGTSEPGTLEFWHTQDLWASDQDELKILYKDSPGSDWVEIIHYADNIEVWTQEILTLPMPSTSYYIAFEGIAKYGYGVCVDDIVVTGTPVIYDNDMAAYQTTGPEMVTAGTTETFSITVKNSGNNIQPNYTVKLMQEGGFELTSLDINTSLESFQTATIDINWDIPSDMISGLTNIYGEVEVTVDDNLNNNFGGNKEIRILPFGSEILVDEDFEGGALPEGWTEELDANNVSWQYQAGGLYGYPSSAHGGDYNAFFADTGNSGTVTKLITPEINLGTSNPGMLKFWHIQDDDYDSFDYLKILYKLSPASEWIELITYDEAVLGWTERIVELPQPSTSFYLAFEGNDNDAYGVCIDDVIITGIPVIYDNDLAVYGTTGPEMITAGTTENYNVMVKNVGNNPIAEYTVKLMQQGDVELATMDITDALASNESIIHTFSWDVADDMAGGLTNIYGKVVLANDDNVNNNNGTYYEIEILSFGTEILVDEDFEAGNLPAGWQEEFDGNGVSWSYMNGGSGGYPNAAHSGAFNAMFYDGDNTGTITRLVSPEINLGTSNPGQLRFWHVQKATYTSADFLKVMYKTSSTGEWIELANYGSEVSNWTERVITLPDPTTSYYIAFEGTDMGGYGTCIDDIIVTGIPIIYDNDLSAAILAGPSQINAGGSYVYNFTVRNVGSLTQDEYTVQLLSNTNDVLGSIDVSNPLSADGEVVHNLVWNVSDDFVPGTTSIHAKVVMAGDENPGNNQTPNFPILVYPAGYNEVSIGNGTEANNRLPVCFQYKNSLTESIYFADEMSSGSTTGGIVESITYYSSFANAITDTPVKIWLGHTELETLELGWIPSTELTLVYDNTVTYPIGENEIVIDLETPFLYMGGNLVVMTQRPFDEMAYTGSDNFYVTETVNHMDRTRYNRDNEEVYEPTAPPEDSFSFEKFANVKFIFTMGATSSIEGHVYGEATAPLAGVEVLIEETGRSTFTDGNGMYILDNVLPETYTVTASAFGYVTSTETVTVGEEETVNQDFTLDPLGVVTISGQLVGSDLPDIGMSNTPIVLSGYQLYETITDANGNFSFAGVYVNHTYSLTAAFEGYESLSLEVIVEAEDMALGVVTMPELTFPVSNIVAVQNGDETLVELSWNTPGGGNTEFRYDDGTYAASVGDASEGPNAVFGAVHPYNAVLNSMSWYLDGTYYSHPTVNLYILGLDSNDRPDRDNVLYIATQIPNSDDEWNVHFFPEDLVANEGFYLGVGTPNVYLSIGLDDGIGAPYEFESGTQYFSTNWTDESVDWQDLGDLSPDYAKNFMIRAGGMNFGELRNAVSSRLSQNNSSSRISSGIELSHSTTQVISKNQELSNLRGLESYNVYRFPAMYQSDPEQWQLVGTGVTDTLYTDNTWSSLDEGNYRFAIKAVYTNNVESIASFSNLIEKTTGADADDIVVPAVTRMSNNYPNPFNPSTTIKFSLKANSDVSLKIFNIKGELVNTLVNQSLEAGNHQVVWEGEDKYSRPCASGVYFYKMKAGRYTSTKKMILMK